MSEKTEHTPGPWDAIEKANFVAVYSDGTLICDVMDMAAEETTNAVRANARLIAAAPELLAALKAACGYMTNATIDLETGAPDHALNTINGGIALVRAALAKVEAA